MILCAIFIAFFTLSGSLADEYDVNINNSYASTYDRIDNLSRHYNDTYHKVTSINTNEDAAFYTGIWSAIQLGIASISGVFSSLSIGTELLTNILMDIGLFDPWVFIVLSGLVIIVLSFVILNWILGRQS